MAIEHLEIPAHLSYFLCIEDDLLRLSRWIEFSADNELVYSIELARLLMTASAEVDVVAKALCKAIDKKSKADNIKGYQTILTTAVPMLPDATVVMPRYGMTFRPWSNWNVKDKPTSPQSASSIPLLATSNWSIKDKPTSPDWWSGNNNVKHHRAECFKDANLKNVLDATAGLLLLLLIFYSKDSHYLSPAPRLFVPRLFAKLEGEALRLVMPDGTQLPWC